MKCYIINCPSMSFSKHKILVKKRVSTHLSPPVLTVPLSCQLNEHCSIVLIATWYLHFYGMKRNDGHFCRDELLTRRSQNATSCKLLHQQELYRSTAVHIYNEEYFKLETAFKNVTCYVTNFSRHSSFETQRTVSDSVLRFQRVYDWNKNRCAREKKTKS